MIPGLDLCLALILPSALGGIFTGLALGLLLRTPK